MNYSTITVVKDERLRMEMLQVMNEWCGATYFNCRFNKLFSVADVVLNEFGFISLRTVSSCGIEYITNLQDINYNVQMGQYINLQKA